MPLTMQKSFHVMVKRQMKSTLFERQDDTVYSSHFHLRSNRCWYSEYINISTILCVIVLIVPHLPNICKRWMVEKFSMLQRLLISSKERTSLGAQWGTDRDCITPFKTLKHTYYGEAEGHEMWKLHHMDTIAENHHTPYSVPAGHLLIFCVCFSSLVVIRGRENSSGKNNNKQLHTLRVRAHAKNKTA